MLSVANESDFNVNHGIYVVKFWANWCGPCKMFSPTIEALDGEFENIDFLSVDVDQTSALAKEYSIRSLPTLLVIANGEEVKRVVGVELITPLRSMLKDITKKYSVKDMAEELLDQVAVM